MNQQLLALSVSDSVANKKPAKKMDATASFVLWGAHHLYIRLEAMPKMA